MTLSPKQTFEQEEALNHTQELVAQATKATEVRDAMLDEVEGLVKKLKKLKSGVEVATNKLGDLNAEIQERTEKLTELDTQIIEFITEVRDYRGRVADLLAQIKDLDDTKRRAVEDIDVLDTEIGNLEARTEEIENQYQIRKATLDKQLSEVQLKLKNTLDSLVEAQRKDKAMRQAWADEHFKLEKRTKVVQEMEARMSDAETRIVELNNYSKLT